MERYMLYLQTLGIVVSGGVIERDYFDEYEWKDIFAIAIGAIDAKQETPLLRSFRQFEKYLSSLDE